MAELSSPAAVIEIANAAS